MWLLHLVDVCGNHVLLFENNNVVKDVILIFNNIIIL
jgi:hypothetical protein